MPIQVGCRTAADHFHPTFGYSVTTAEDFPAAPVRHRRPE